MKGQSVLILGLIAAIVISIFAVINVDNVSVNYMFGEAEWPLILVILGSVLMGAIVAGSLALMKIYRLRQELRQVKKQVPVSASKTRSGTERRSSAPENEKTNV
ncbi:lipopolysaccharide assembly LapA domain-containing protein [Alteribacillus sp. HJP-4]|uniref:LapA family protein n=1 Tax=Alteribacillus sp. HJP-4 TaxID=2775394 RepID=UPI0035CD1835